MLPKIGIIVANQKEFLQFCREHQISIKSDLIKNLKDLASVEDERFSCVYITQYAKFKRHAEEMIDIVSYIRQHCFPIVYINE
jgi:hypothetical protein